LLASCGERIEPAQLGAVGENVGEIRGEHTTGQTFVAQHDGLQAVEVLLATYARKNTQPIVFHLRQDPQSAVDLRTVSLPAAEIADNEFHRFSFEPIADSHLQRYYFAISSPGSEPGDAITAWIGPADGYREGSLYIDGQAREGQMIFKLGYDNAYAVSGLFRDFLSGLPVILAAVALFVLPGLALLMCLVPVWSWDWLTALIVACGLSAAMFPLLLLFSRAFGVRWNSILAWLFLAVCFVLVIWRVSRVVAQHRVQSSRLEWRRLVRRPTPEIWLLGAVVILVIGVRWFVVRQLSVPMWGDSHQHSYITQLMLENGGLFDSWEPYSPYASLTVHFGFHAATAFFHWVTGKDVLSSVILVGQIFNALAVLVLYPLAVRISRGSSEPDRSGRWAGLAAVLVAGLLMSMPMEYVNWGRYPQLAGQTILLVALWLLWVSADHQGKGEWTFTLLAGFAAAGMALTYYRMPYYYAAFVLVWLLFYGLGEWRRNTSQWFTVLKRVALVGLVAVFLVLPWRSNLTGGRLATALAQGVRAAPSVERVWADYRAWQDIDLYVPIYLCVLSLVGMVWSVAKRQWVVTMLGFWSAILASFVAARLIHMPGANQMQSFAILIALYIPVGLVVGWMVGQLSAAVADRWEARGAGMVVVALLVVAVLGSRERVAVVDPAYALVSQADTVALDWINDNTPSNATFLVNGFLIYGGRSVVGSDAGWWIPFLAGRNNTMPPQYALLNEVEAIPGYGGRVVQLVADLNEHAPTSTEGLEELCAFGVTHIYIGQGQGKVAREDLTPFLIPSDLVASPFFELQYHQDRVWIFAVKGDACS
jgi:hypothetical protein